MSKKIIVGVLVLLVIVGIALRFKKTKTLPPVSDIKEVDVNNDVKTPVENNVVELLKEFGKNVTLKVGEKITFTDGLKITLVKINDSRCKEGVQCFWAGELAGTFEISGGKLTKPQNIYMGTTTNQSVSSVAYNFYLKSIPEKSIDSAEIMVEYKK